MKNKTELPQERDPFAVLFDHVLLFSLMSGAAFFLPWQHWALVVFTALIGWVAGGRLAHYTHSRQKL
jgi:hypothetical protein